MPVGMGPNQTGKPTDTVGETADLSVDQPRGQAVPGLVIGERWIGQARAQAIVEPAVEIGKTRRHPHDPLVAPLVRLDRWRQHRCRLRSAVPVSLALWLRRWLQGARSF